MVGQPLVQRVVKLHGPIAAGLRQLDPSRTSSERTFGHGVSPSPPGKRARLGAPRVGRVRMATAAIGPCTPRKSQSVVPSIQ
jgi:hypothetical protein